MGTVIQSATYKLNNVCNAGSLPRGRLRGLSSGTDVHNNQLQLEYTTRYADSQDIFSISCASRRHIREQHENNLYLMQKQSPGAAFYRVYGIHARAALHLEKSIA